MKLLYHLFILISFLFVSASPLTSSETLYQRDIYLLLAKETNRYVPFEKDYEDMLNIWHKDSQRKLTQIYQNPFAYFVVSLPPRQTTTSEQTLEETLKQLPKIKEDFCSKHKEIQDIIWNSWIFAPYTITGGKSLTDLSFTDLYAIKKFFRSHRKNKYFFILKKDKKQNTFFEVILNKNLSLEFYPSIREIKIIYHGN